MLRFPRRFVVLGLLACVAGGVLPSSMAQAAPAKNAQPLVAFAAASLQEALTDAGNAFAATGHPKPRISFAGSSTLARQIERGAPAALFISADEEWMDYLAERKLLQPGSRATFLTNRLVLIAPAAKPFKADIGKSNAWVRSLGSGRIAMADPASVPAGRYGKAALENLGLWQELQSRVIPASNVRSALMFVERGEASAGIVYATDAAATSKVTVAGVFPAKLHPPIRYVVSILKGGDTAEARAFRAFLLSPKGKAIFTKRGFQAE